jgi:hypothetical protein
MVQRRRGEHATVRPGDGQWLYDTADGGDVFRIARTPLMWQNRAEAMDGQNSGTRAVTNWAKRLRLRAGLLGLELELAD